MRHHGGGPFGRYRRRFEPGAPPVRPAPLDTPQRLHGLWPLLELNERQKEEAREAFADVAMALGATWQTWSGLDEALAAVAAEPFDKGRAQAVLAGLQPEPTKLIVDALEHVHNILTPEQRERLDEALQDWR
jgi:Spy/CpxP family protein refolding chaperone